MRHLNYELWSDPARNFQFSAFLEQKSFSINFPSAIESVICNAIYCNKNRIVIKTSTRHEQTSRAHITPLRFVPSLPILNLTIFSFVFPLQNFSEMWGRSVICSLWLLHKPSAQSLHYKFACRGLFCSLLQLFPMFTRRLNRA